MTRFFLALFLFIFSNFVWGQTEVFQGKVELDRDLASFETRPPVPGTLYLLTGAAAAVRIVSKEPFVAEVDFVEGEWKGETDLVAHRAVLRFEGSGWASKVIAKKPRTGGDDVIYPYRKFQVAAIPSAGGFRALSIPVLF
jgi:hypothetical protein